MGTSELLGQPDRKLAGRGGGDDLHAMDYHLIRGVMEVVALYSPGERSTR